MKSKLYLPYLILTIVTFLFALLLQHIIPVVYYAAQTAWPETRDLMPAGLVMVSKYRYALFLVPCSCGLLGISSIQIKSLSSANVTMLIACVAFTIIIVFVFMLCTPIILHGGKIG